MNLELANIQDIVELNDLIMISNPILYNRGCVPTEDGLFSTNIFGISNKDRSNRFAYINLYGKYLHPDAYKAFRRLNRNIDLLIAGTQNFTIDKEGNLVKSESGGTGIKWLYNNWEKLKWQKTNSSMRNERIDLLTKHKKDILFVDKWLIMPAAYRDMNLQKMQQSTDEINSYYTKLIRLANMSVDGNNFDFMLYNTQFNIQMELVRIYDYLKNIIEKKNGAIRKSLMGKSVDYSCRLVITSPQHNYDSFLNNKNDLETAGVPLSSCLVLFFPFIINWLRNYFIRELDARKNRYPVKLPNSDKIGYVKLEEPSVYFNDEFLKEQVEKFIHSYSTRFEPITVPIKTPEVIGRDYIYLYVVGREYNYENKDADPATLSVLFNRKMTWADLLYRAAVDVTRDKHVVITRYPVLDYFGSFITRIFVKSTSKTMPVNIDGTVYEDYPVIDENMRPENISTIFPDSLTFSNMMLEGIGGDYDGDQVTIKGLYSQEANMEAEEIMNSLSYIININGENMRTSSKECIEGLYQLTRRA